MKSLFIVATPIGNLQDITLRAIDTLKKVDLIVCEDTRVSQNLLKKYEIKKPLFALNEFNEETIVYDILQKLETQDIALISDAGTPLISDPGFKLVRKAREKNFRIIPIPGPTAFVAALSASGLPTDKFIFLGFLPKNKTKAQKVLEEAKATRATIILYESPYRIFATLNLINETFGNIDISIARELTKIHEEIISEKVEELINRYEKINPKGEFVVLFNLKASQS